MSTEQYKTLVKQALEHFNNPANRSKYLEIHDANCVYHGLPPGLSPGIEGIKQFYQMYWAGFPDGKVAIEDLFTEGDKLVCRFTFSGTHQGELMGIPPTGNQVSVGGITILRFANDKCVERWNQVDMMGMMQQLGVVPSPGQ